MYNHPQAKARHARRTALRLAASLWEVGDLGGAEQALKEARAAHREAVRWDRPVKYHPGVVPAAMTEGARA